MELASGTKLGAYQILAVLGSGGMGQVYRARDINLSREVAVKVLPETFACDPDRIARFRREAQVLASLNHPNIASVYGLEQSGSLQALILELVEGPTLADQLAHGPIALDEALALTQQIAEALEYAHEHGIIHRDLKPANVKITAEGQVKVLDFGLAKVLSPETTDKEPLDSPTLTAATGAGILLGTAAYMSPEQARGKRVDRRADIWAFGCVLYEMLTGQRAFAGETTSDALAAIITCDPDWRSLPASLPPPLRELVRRCLTKDSRQRLRDIGDARIIIEEVLSGSPTWEVAPASTRAQPFWLRAMPWALLAVAVVVGALGAGLAWYTRPRAALPSVSRFSLLLPSGEAIAVAGFPGADLPAVAISRDGSELAYVAAQHGKNQLFLRPMDRLEALPLQGTDGAFTPFFSPDGQWIGFFGDGKLKKVSVHGGEPITLCDAPFNRGATWADDDTIIFAPDLFSGLMRVSAVGGTPQVLTTPDVSNGEVSHRWPEALPGAKAIVFVSAKGTDIGSFSESKIVVERLDTHETKILPILGSYPRYSPSGHLLFQNQGRVFAVPFRLNQLEVSGPAVPVLDNVKTSANSGVAELYLSRTGSLVYVPETAAAPDEILTWVYHGNQTKPIAAPVRAYRCPHVSPDGQRLAVEIESGSNVDIWIYDLRRGTLTRLTFDGSSRAPLWTPDGKRITFMTLKRAGPAIVSKAADGSGQEEILVAGAQLLQIPESWSPDGRFLAFMAMAGGVRNIFVLPLNGEHKPRPFVQAKFDQGDARFSPDGRWLAYTSTESGKPEVYVQPFPGPGGKWQVSTDGGTDPLWAHNGREFFFWQGDKLLSVAVATQPNFSASTPRFVADVPVSPPFGLIGNGRYDVNADGQRFLFVKATGALAVGNELDLILNFAEDVKRLSPSAAQR
jgi:eukaryotic-like serine/threonine-protein kinase